VASEPGAASTPSPVAVALAGGSTTQPSSSSARPTVTPRSEPVPSQSAQSATTTPRPSASCALGVQALGVLGSPCLVK
jgi:hypothetical protein